VLLEKVSKIKNEAQGRNRILDRPDRPDRTVLPEARRGSPPLGSETMRRIYFLQHGFDLSDPAAEGCSLRQRIDVAFVVIGFRKAIRAIRRFQGITASISERKRSRRVCFPFVVQTIPTTKR